MRGVEALDIVQGDGLQPLNRPGIDVPKGMTLIEGELQGPLAQVFIVVSPELVGEEIDRFISQSGEILRVESGVQDGVPEDRVEPIEMIPVTLTRDDDELFVGLRRDLRGHGGEG